jgi:GntR family transcriptional regulator
MGRPLELSSPYDDLAAAGQDPSARVLRNEQVPASADVAAAPTVPGAALLTVRRTAYDDTGRAVEYGTHVYRASRYAFDFQLLARP